MAIRLEKSGELMFIRGIQDETDDQNEWKARRRKLEVLLVAVVAVTAALYFSPYIPGHEMVSSAFKSLVAAVW